MHTSAIGNSLPPSLPVSAMTSIPLALASLAASSTFSEFPDVLMANNTSPVLPKASMYRENTYLYP